MSASPLRILFAGTPGFAASHLERLIASKHHILAVYTQPDRPAGRGRKLHASPVKQMAELAGLTVCSASATTPLVAANFTERIIYHSSQTPGYTAWTGVWSMPDGR